jgi:hypothetical protein
MFKCLDCQDTGMISGYPAEFAYLCKNCSPITELLTLNRKEQAELRDFISKQYVSPEFLHLSNLLKRL